MRSVKQNDGSDIFPTIKFSHCVNTIITIILTITLKIYLCTTNFFFDHYLPPLEIYLIHNMSEENQLSAKELKTKKKAEKAAKRAANKESQGLPAQSTRPQGGGPSSTNHGFSSSAKIGPGDKRMALFDHLEQSGRTSTLTAPKEVHPAVLKLGLQISSFKVIGSTNRCRSMLEAFKQVVQDYRTPEGTSFSRHFQSILSQQIEFLKSARPLSISMGNSIRWLKQVISKISIDITEQEAKDQLIEVIDNFIRERIDVADQVIVDSAADNIEDGDVVLTYGHSLVVKDALLKAHETKQFSVVVVDSRPLFEGKKLAKDLTKAGVSCSYVLINALSYVMKDVTTVFLGAHSMLSNGLLYARIGTAMVTMSAKTRNVPVLVLCETIKFTDRVQLDSVTYNELASPDQLVNISVDPEKTNYESSSLKNWKEQTGLGILNILYDLSPTGTIKKVITELGSLPPSSVPVVLREYKYTQ